MRTDRQLTLAFSVLLGLHVVTSLAAVALFGRMAPAIERIIEENVASVSAVEGMLDAALRARLGEPLEVARRNFDEALAVAARTSRRSRKDGLSRKSRASRGRRSRAMTRRRGA